MLKIDKDKCTGCGECEEVCAFGAISIKEDVAEVDHDSCTLCGTCVDTCPSGALEIEAKKAEQRSFNKDEWRGVWVVAEFRLGKIFPVTFELLGCARRLADKLGVNLSAVLIGSGVKMNLLNMVQIKSM